MIDGNMVLLEQRTPQVGSKRYDVLLLFFTVRNQIYMLIGREKSGHAAMTDDDKSEQSG